MSTAVYAASLFAPSITLNDFIGTGAEATTGAVVGFVVGSDDPTPVAGKIFGLVAGICATASEAMALKDGGMWRRRKSLVEIWTLRASFAVRSDLLLPDE